MKTSRMLAVALIAGLVAMTTGAKTLTFAGRAWTISPNGSYAPGPNNWSENNAWVDASGQLHLKISRLGNKWYSAQVRSNDKPGFGTYQWHVAGRLDKLDKNVVLGLYSYLGPDGINEIDIEMAKWGKATNSMCNFTVWPNKTGYGNTTKSFSINLDGDYTTHRLNWQSRSVVFRVLHGHRADDNNEMAKWSFSPTNHLDCIPQQSMPVYMNLWLFNGQSPSDGREVEIVIKTFNFSPAGAAPACPQPP